jgi:glutamate--cysteine ligase
MNQHFDNTGVLASQVRSVSDYIARGIEHGCGDCIGLELEHFIVRADDLSYVPYFDDPATGAVGVGTILKRLAPFYDEEIYETQNNGNKNLIGLSRRLANITLEPGAQFEISIGPVLRVQNLDIIYQDFRAEIDPLLAEYGYRLLELGYHPTASAHNISLIPKDRYYLMDEHFKSTGKHGICMMRASASTQVSIDYASEADAIRKFRIANAIGPLLAFVTDNSPLFESTYIGSGKATASGMPIPTRMARTSIWDDVDARRSMVAPHTFDEGFGFESYAASILESPAIFTTETDGNGEKRSVRQGMKSFAEVLTKQGLDRATIEHVLSLFFFDVRFKTYIEIRMADSLPVEYALAFAALIKGLFYSEENLRRIEELLGWHEATGDGDEIRDRGALGGGATVPPVQSAGTHAPPPTVTNTVASAKTSLRGAGYDALVYGRGAAEWLDDLIGMAQTFLSVGERSYLEPLARLVAARTTLADSALAAARAVNASTPANKSSDATVADTALAGADISFAIFDNRSKALADVDADAAVATDLTGTMDVSVPSVVPDASTLDALPLDEIAANVAAGGELVLEATSTLVKILAELIAGMLAESA